VAGGPWPAKAQQENEGRGEVPALLVPDLSRGASGILPRPRRRPRESGNPVGVVTLVVFTLGRGGSGIVPRPGLAVTISYTRLADDAGARGAQNPYDRRWNVTSAWRQQGFSGRVMQPIPQPNETADSARAPRNMANLRALSTNPAQRGGRQTLQIPQRFPLLLRQPNER